MKPGKIKFAPIGLVVLSFVWGSAPALFAGIVAVTGNDPDASLATASPASSAPAPVAPVESPENFVMPVGTRLRIRLDSTVSAVTSRPGDPFSGTLASPAVLNGVTALPVGTSVGGYVVDAEPSEQNAILTLRMDAVVLGDKTLRVSTASDIRVSGGHTNREVSWISSGADSDVPIGAGLTEAVALGRRRVMVPAETELILRPSKSPGVPDNTLES